MKGRNNTEHITIIIEIQAKINKENKFSWKIKSETDCQKYQQRIQYKLTKDEPNTCKESERLIYDSAPKTVPKIQITKHQIVHNKDIKDARKQKLRAKKEHRKAFR